MRDVYEPPPPRGHPAHDERRRRDRDPRNDREYYSSRDPYYGGDSYRDRGDRYDGYAAYGREDNYRPPPPPPQPLRRRSPDRYDAPDSGFTFRGAAGRDTHQRPLEDFSFRAPGPQFPAPTGPAATRLPHAPQPDNRVGGGRGGRVGRGRQNDRGGRRWAAKPHVSDRDILHETGRARTPEQLEGMNIDGQVRFRAVETSSDESDYNAAAPHSSSEEEGEIRRKRFKVGTPPAALNEAPKWSNPDPYTSLPAQPFGNAPRKDIVQVIRKAKAEPAPRLDVTQSATAKNDDFISFTFDDDLNMDGDSAADEREDNAMNDDSDVEFVGENPVKGLNSFNGINPPKGPSAPAINLRAAGRGNQGGVKAAPPPALTEMTEEEQLGQQAGGKKAKKRKLEDLAIGLGEVTPEWATKNASESTPWFTIDKTGTVDADLRLHKEIADFYEFVRPQQHEETTRAALIDRVQKTIQSSKQKPDAKNVKVECFGSFAAGLYLPTADMDLVAVSKSFMASGQKSFCQSGTKMHQLANYLENSSLALSGSISVITRSKVPIIKYVDSMTGIKVDISFENDSGLHANKTFAQWKQEFPAMPVIVVIIKQLLAMRDLNEVFSGGLGGFSIICLVVSMMQLFPRHQDELTADEEHYGHLLMDFLDLYGNHFDIRSKGIRFDPPQHFDKVRHPLKMQNDRTLTIMDPNRPSNDISGGSREIDAVFGVFRKAHAKIRKQLDQIRNGQSMNQSILGCVLGGDYTSFSHQREKLSRLDRGLIVSPPPASAVGAPTRAMRRQATQANYIANKFGYSAVNHGAPIGGGPANLPARPTAAPPQPAAGHSNTNMPAKKVKQMPAEKRAIKFRKDHPELAHLVSGVLPKPKLKKLELEHGFGSGSVNKEATRKKRVDKKVAKSKAKNT